MQPYTYTTVDKKGRDKEVEVCSFRHATAAYLYVYVCCQVHLDERDPVYIKLRGLELQKVCDLN